MAQAATQFSQVENISSCLSRIRINLIFFDIRPLKIALTLAGDGTPVPVVTVVATTSLLAVVAVFEPFERSKTCRLWQVWR